MNEIIQSSLNNIRVHSEALMKVPASEQFIGSIQAIVSIAIIEIATCLEQIANENPRR